MEYFADLIKEIEHHKGSIEHSLHFAHKVGEIIQSNQSDDFKIRSIKKLRNEFFESDLCKYYEFELFDVSVRMIIKKYLHEQAKTQPIYRDISNFINKLNKGYGRRIKLSGCTRYICEVLGVSYSSPIIRYIEDSSYSSYYLYFICDSFKPKYIGITSISPIYRFNEHVKRGKILEGDFIYISQLAMSYKRDFLENIEGVAINYFKPVYNKAKLNYKSKLTELLNACD